MLARAVVEGLGSARTLVLARLLTPGDFGIMGAAMVVLAGMEAFTGTGFETALTQRRGDIDEFYDSAFTLHVLRGFALAGVLWLAAPAAAAFFGSPTLVPVLRAVGLIFIFRGLMNPAKVRFVRDLRYDTLFWWGLPEGIVGLALAIILGLTLGNVWALVISVIATQAVASIVSHIIARRRVRFALHWARLREIARYGKWVLATQLTAFLNGQGDTAFVGRMLGVGSLGLYQMAFRISELPVTALTQVVGQVALPSLSALQDERERAARWYFAAQRLVLVAHGAFVVLILLFGGFLTRVILGAKWLPIVPVLKILAVAMLIRSVVDIGGTLFNALGEPRFAYRIHALRLALMAAAIYPLAKLWQLEGVAVAVLVGLVGAGLLYARTLRATLGVGWIEHLRRPAPSGTSR